MAFAKRYYNFLLRYKIPVLLFWLVLLAVSFAFGISFLSHTKTVFGSPTNSASHIASRVNHKNFNDTESGTKYVLLVSHLYEDEYKTVLEPPTYLNDTCQKLKTALTSYVVPDIYSKDSLLCFFTVEKGMLRDAVGNRLIAADNQSSLIIFQSNHQDDLANKEFFHFMQDFIKERQLDTPEFEIVMTGVLPLLFDTLSSVISDLIMTDAIVIPISFGIFCLVVRDIRLSILPLVAIAASVFCSFALMLPVALYGMDVASVAPNIMMALCVAMSLDYCLFLLTRMREELHKHKRRLILAMEIVVTNAGKVIVLSGTTLAITFAGLLIFPVDFLRSVGVSAVISLLCTMLVSLSLLPSLILTFPRLFGLADSHGQSAANLLNVVSSPTSQSEIENDSSPLLKPHKKRTFFGKIRYNLSGMWIASARFSTGFRASIFVIIIVLVCACPFAIQVLHMPVSLDNTAIYPSDADSVKALQKIGEHFPKGYINPFSITAVINATLPSELVGDGYSVAGPMLLEKHLVSLDSLAIKLANNTRVRIHLNGIQGISRSPTGGSLLDMVIDTPDHGKIPVRLALPYCFDPDSYFGIMVYHHELCVLYREVYWLYTNGNGTATRMTLFTDADPFGEHGNDMVHAVRETIEAHQNCEAERDSDLSYYVSGGNANGVDAIDQIMATFPTSIAVTATAVFIVVSVVYRSVFIPFRLLFTLAVPILWVYGMASLVYDVYWVTPVVTFSILVGLGMDYDLFLFNRVKEYRDDGFTDRSAVISAVHRTGGIISAAGLIMAVAFGGMINSPVVMLQQFGWALCVSVLIDTFIIRTLLVPAIIALAGRLNWWPGKVPPGEKDVLDSDNPRANLLVLEHDTDDYTSRA